MDKFLEKLFTPVGKFIDNYIAEPVGNFVNTISGAKAAQDFSASEAEKQRNWEEQMSNSAYQRSMEDMKKAGLNPAAMYSGVGGAASTPSGASASSSGGGQFGNVIGGIASAVNSIGNMTSSMNASNEQGAKIKAYERANDMLRTASHLAARYASIVKI